MQIKKIFSFTALLTAFAVAGWLFIQFQQPEDLANIDKPERKPLAQTQTVVRSYQPQLQAILENKIQFLGEQLHQNVIIESLIQYNAAHADLDEATIALYDEAWKNSALMTAKDTQLINQQCSHILTEIQKQQPEISEMFITSIKGLNVCQTNKTSDYYQADEIWWQHIFEEPQYIGQIEYDFSAQIESIPIYFSLYEPKTNTLVGIVKVVLDKKKLGREL